MRTSAIDPTRMRRIGLIIAGEIVVVRTICLVGVGRHCRRRRGLAIVVVSDHGFEILRDLTCDHALQ